MAKFRRKPTVIDAVQFKMPKRRPKTVGPDKNFVGVDWHDFGSSQQHPYVTTIHGQRTHIADGDWILPEGDGVHFYPCKPDVFEAIYEPATSVDD